MLPNVSDTTHNTPQLVALLEEELERCHALVTRLVRKDLPKPEYRLDLRGKTAGLALLREHCIRFNLNMLLAHGRDFIAEVVPHEMAHLVAYQRFGNRIRPHGAQWQWLMRDVFDRPPQVTHSFSARLSHRRVFWYACGCEQPREFSLTRHRRSMAGTTYSCRRCKQTMHYLGKNPRPGTSVSRPANNGGDQSKHATGGGRERPFRPEQKNQHDHPAAATLATKSARPMQLALF